MAATNILIDTVIRAVIKAVAQSGKARKFSDGAGLILDVHPTGAGW